MAMRAIGASRAGRAGMGWRAGSDDAPAAVTVEIARNREALALAKCGLRANKI